MNITQRSNGSGKALLLSITDIAAAMSGASTEELKYQRSLAPSSVPLPYSITAAVDPEEAVVAAALSCYMFTFLALAAKRDFVIDRYLDEAIGSMERNDRDKLYVSKIVLSPDVTFGGSKQPTERAR